VVGIGVAGYREGKKPQDLCHSFVRRLKELDDSGGERLKY
jgi:hypothetical protein